VSSYLFYSNNQQVYLWLIAGFGAQKGTVIHVAMRAYPKSCRIVLLYNNEFTLKQNFMKSTCKAALGFIQLGCTILVGGCTAIPTFKPPLEGSIAQIMFLPEKSLANAYIISEAGCKRTALPVSHEYQFRGAWMNLGAGERVTISRDLSISSQYVRTTCSVRLSFIPKAGEKYESVFESDKSHCYSKLYLVAADGTRKVEETARFEESGIAKSCQ
jgi:hypothetical protein